ncbi:MAG: CBS domain-containing protein [Planctomycetaceae bacterium]|jgi:CBS domain-containing protein|nr:CBS domain-containing protein [Planctomycetaceae bacterium]MBT6153902.1 CBS domain-containing protein [Planctomycetaceae bacterium]MBT6486627.1 CBS domain-containing protein [Planctomycetaceae bacterium]MBT6496823.1 CBS domain-containing protein [Planctomycetaceae bacterium]
MGLKENLERDTVEKLELRAAITLTAEQSIRDAIEAMRRGGLGCAIIVDDQRHPTGIFTEAMLRNAIFHSPECVDDQLSEHTAETFPWVVTSDPVETVLDAMEIKNHRFVVVVDESGAVVGLTGQKGLMEYVADHFSEEVMVQRVGAEAYPNHREGA